MTVVAEHENPPKESRQWGRRRGPLGSDVARVVAGLQMRLLAPKPHQEAISALARLRRGISREPGFDYTLDTYLAVSDDLLTELKEHVKDGATTAAEYAKHAAVTMYALHQQSQRERMHVDGRGLGHAIGDLARASSGPEGVRRRFAALGTAISFDEVSYHLRSLIVMLREHKIPLDYGLLADDLRTMRLPGRRAKMQATWGREYFRARPANTDESPKDTTEETE